MIYAFSYIYEVGRIVIRSDVISFYADNAGKGSPGIGNGNPTPVFSPGKSHRQRSLAGCRSMGLQRVGHDWATEHIMPALNRRRDWSHKWLNDISKLVACSPGEGNGLGFEFGSSDTSSRPFSPPHTGSDFFPQLLYIEVWVQQGLFTKPVIFRCKIEPLCQTVTTSPWK